MSSHGDEDRIEDDQLPVEDTLDDRGLEDNLDEGYSPPEKLRGSTAKSVTPEGELEGETIDERLPQEEPDPEAAVAYDELDPEAPLDSPIEESIDDGEVGEERSGRLVQTDEGVDMVGEDVGIDGGAASAEEAAVHEIPEE
jgi:hypothetical protein